MANETKFDLDELVAAHEFAVDFWKQLGIPVNGGSMRDEAIRTHFDRLRRLTIAYGEILAAAPEIKDRGAECYRAATRDVVFILQSATKHWSEDCRLAHIEEATKDDFSEWSPCDMCLTTWYPRGIWLTRAEAEAYGKSREYNYPQGWRVYGLCAEGSLAKLLKLVSVRAGADYTSKPRDGR